jgi:hypothetical protein
MGLPAEYWMIGKKAIKETIDMKENELNEWIEKRKNGSWFANFEAVYIENHHPLKIKWDQLKGVDDEQKA